MRRRPASGAGARNGPGDADSTPATEEEIAPEEASPSFRPHLAQRGSIFRRRHRLHGPFALYGGRIDPGKGCEELIEYFSTYVQEGGDATLVLMGVKLMPLPEEPFIRFAGRLSDQERLQALEAATVVVVPSPYESLSLLALESFAVGTPVLANARSEVLVDHCRKSNAGLYYADRDEFSECAEAAGARPRAARRRSGRNGQQYVRTHYRWDVILAKYERMFTQLRGQGRKRRHSRLTAPNRVGHRRRSRPRRRARRRRDGPPRRAALAPRADVVALDHLVQRRRLDVQQLGGPLLHAAGRFERGLDQRASRSR